jgi:hypothetical protein
MVYIKQKKLDNKDYLISPLGMNELNSKKLSGWE